MGISIVSTRTIFRLRVQELLKSNGIVPGKLPRGYAPFCQSDYGLALKLTISTDSGNIQSSTTLLNYLNCRVTRKYNENGFGSQSCGI